LDVSSTTARLNQIATAEHVTISDQVISTLVTTSSGDLRRSITYLQSASRLSAATSPPTVITSRDIQEIAGVVPDEVINDFARSLGIEVFSDSGMDVDLALSSTLKGFDRIREAVKHLMREGYSASQILSQVVTFPDGSSHTESICSCMIL
jgi:replication factor C subunit 2/4